LNRRGESWRDPLRKEFTRSSQQLKNYVSDWKEDHFCPPVGVKAFLVVIPKKKIPRGGQDSCRGQGLKRATSEPPEIKRAQEKVKTIKIEFGRKPKERKAPVTQGELQSLLERLSKMTKKNGKERGQGCGGHPGHRGGFVLGALLV